MGLVWAVFVCQTHVHQMRQASLHLRCWGLRLLAVFSYNPPQPQREVKSRLSCSHLDLFPSSPCSFVQLVVPLAEYDEEKENRVPAGTCAAALVAVVAADDTVHQFGKGGPCAG